MRVVIDTRELQPGDIFIPVKGERFDGHEFIEEALRKGAQKVLDVDIGDYAKSYRRKLTCQVIAVTGSAGKTTVKDLLASVLSQRYKVVATKGNYNNEIGLPLTVLQADADTDILIVELGMRGAGQIRYLARICRPTHVVITGVGYSHIEILKSQHAIAMAKSEVFLSPLDWEHQPRMAFLNHETPYYDLLARRARSKKFKVFPYTGSTKPDQNLNVVYAVARHFGLTNDQIREGIRQFQSSAHRLKPLPAGGVTVIDDAYNANPDGVQFALQYLGGMDGRKLLVLGDMLELGDQGPELHRRIADQALEAGVSLILTLGPLGHHVASDDIEVMHFDAREALHHFLKAELKTGDVVMVKGSRGMKMELTVDFLVGERFDG
ncbi:MAG: UDP-N-acetylmuramoyl-tripeptide--D-alanyl-D-alanine ligase [Candidatus Margulisiibacteriota bacterium]